MSRVTTVLTLSILCACSVGNQELPKLHATSSPEPCLWPPPPPIALVITAGRDPAPCLPQRVRERGLSVSVLLTDTGEAAAVDADLDLCLDVDADGNVIPKHHLSPEEKRGILDALRGWHFATLPSCGQAYAFLDIGGKCTSE
jgi:hypothetical protein